MPAQEQHNADRCSVSRTRRVPGQVIETGIPAAILAERVKAGESLEDLAADYGAIGHFKTIGPLNADSIMTESWSREEVEATVVDYFRMLSMELAGQQYNKSQHRRRLLASLDGRSEAAVERKHQNVSAILIELGCPFILGYRPLGNYQTLLFQVVESRVIDDAPFNKIALEAVERLALPVVGDDFDKAFVSAPILTGVSEPASSVFKHSRNPIQRDYLEREARNRSLGLAGEEFVVALERVRLKKAGCEKLAKSVDHVARTRGDGLGYDVLSFDSDGRERFIEVKTTSFGITTPFYLTQNELEFSEEEMDRFRLYRVFQFRSSPRVFDVKGAIRGQFQLDPVTYRARFS